MIRPKFDQLHSKMSGLGPVKFYIFVIVFVLFSTHVKCNDDCTDLNIRNSVDHLNKIENCTVVTGYLAILLLEHSLPEDYERVVFPKLREITGFLIVYRAFGLKSIGQLFPNLIVIRGLKLFLNKYALVVFDNEDIEEIGLKSLIQIQRGFVRIQSNSKLCFTDTVLWKNITMVDEPNVIDPVDVKCRKRSSKCIGCEPAACWSRQYCQRFDTPQNFTGKNVTCHQSCLGGCYNDASTIRCFACRNITGVDGECTDECKAPTLLNDDTNHCVYPEQCWQMDRIVFGKLCVNDCPPGYIVKATNTTTVYKQKTCVFCRPNCPIICSGTEIYSLDDARKLQGCTVINGTLLLRLNLDALDIDIYNDLERYLGEIEEITNFLKVYLSTSLTTLSFFKNLRVIHGKVLENGKFALIIYDNPNLKTLWNWTEKLEFTMSNGGMLIYYNAKLCLAEITKFKAITKYSNSSDIICRATNGNKQSCNVTPIFGQTDHIYADNATIKWATFKSEDQNYNLLGYTVSYIETVRNDITPQYGKDVCSKFGWHTVLITTDMVITQKQKLHQYTMTNLKPNTQYGVYVTSFSINDENSNVIDGQTDILYFTTRLATPKIPIVGTASKTSTSIQIRWVIDETENDLIENFKIFVLHNVDSIDVVNQHSFCKRSDQIGGGEDEISALELLPCCIPTEKISYDKLVEISMIFQARSKPMCFEIPIAQCHHLPYTPANNPQSDSYYNYNNYYNNIDYEFRNVIFQYVGLNNFRPSVIYPHNYTLKNNHRDYNITNLKPFGMYKFIVAACNKENDCSPFYLHTDRTDPLRDNDRIEFEITNTTDSIILYFTPPPNPNGITIAFQIDCLIIGDPQQEGMICVTQKEHELKNYTFTFHDMPNGSYAIRIRSISLAGYGAFTPWKLFDVYENISDTKLQHTLTFIFIAFLVVIILILILVYKYYLVRHCCKSRSRIADRANLITMEYKPAVEEISWHLNYDSDGSEFSGFSGFNRSTSVEDPEPGTSNPFSRSPSTAHTEHERI